MKIYTDSADPRWTRYSSTSGGKTPIIKQNVTGQIVLVSPSDKDDTVELHTPGENIFTLTTFKKLQEEWSSIKNFQDREGELVIKFSHIMGLTVERRGVHRTQFHCMTKSSLEFLIKALEVIEKQRTES